jgi:hypothetical protein
VLSRRKEKEEWKQHPLSEGEKYAFIFQPVCDVEKLDCHVVI